jgi:hypothetical protein
MDAIKMRKFFGHPDVERLFGQMTETIDRAEAKYYTLEHSE